MTQYFAEGRFGTTNGGPMALKSGLADVPGRPVGERGEVFLKSPSSITGPGQTIVTLTPEPRSSQRSASVKLVT